MSSCSVKQTVNMETDDIEVGLDQHQYNLQGKFSFSLADLEYSVSNGYSFV